MYSDLSVRTGMLRDWIRGLNLSYFEEISLVRKFNMIQNTVENIRVLKQESKKGKKNGW